MTVSAAAILQAPAGASSYTPLLFEFAVIGVIFYFLLLRPQQQQRKKHEEALRSVKKGDDVVTAGGIIGKVIHIKDGEPSPTMEDRVTIESGESRIVVERGRITKIGLVDTSEPPRGRGAPGLL